MKVTVTIINTSCIIVSEAVTVPSLMMMISTVSGESRAIDTHTHTYTTYGHSQAVRYHFRLIKCINVRKIYTRFRIALTSLTLLLYKQGKTTAAHSVRVPKKQNYISCWFAQSILICVSSLFP